MSSRKRHIKLDQYDEKLREEIIRQLRRREIIRKLILFITAVAAVCCIGYFGIYQYFSQKNASERAALEELKERAPISGNIAAFNPKGVYKDMEIPDILDEYKNLYNKNKSLIGWIKIDDTYIDYPVMQSSDSEYYLDHNFEQQHDKNGSIFMDPGCNVLTPSTNLILYGHHMNSGKMFGSLTKYEDESYGQEHSIIKFDSIYKKGRYQLMFAFRSRLYSTDEVNFKYYQFIDASSPEEFYSNITYMKELSLYDTGVTAQYGDELLTLSTCDYQEKNGRFVVVAKRIS